MTSPPAPPPPERRRFVVIGLGGLAALKPTAADGPRPSPGPRDAEAAARVLEALRRRVGVKPG